jgi:hypothetical protein
MLAEIYAWFTEGFDTQDLLEAKVLLEELVEALYRASPKWARPCWLQRVPGASCS